MAEEENTLPETTPSTPDPTPLLDDDDAALGSGA